MNEPLGYEIPHKAVDTENELLIKNVRHLDNLPEPTWQPYGMSEDLDDSEYRHEQALIDSKNLAKKALSSHSEAHMSELHENAIHEDKIRDAINQYNTKQ